MIYLAENIRMFRKKMGMTQEEVAEAVFVSPQSVSKWERGETMPDIELLPALAKLFSTSIDALIGMERIHDDQAKGEIFRRAHDCYEAGDYAAAAEIHREGLRRFPNDDGMLSELSMSMAMLPGGMEEAIDIGQRLIAGNGSEKIKHTMRAALCMMYKMKGDSIQAERLARNLPHARESREEILAALERGGVSGENERYLRYLTLGRY